MVDKFDLFQVRTLDPCTYYSCDEHFSAVGSDVDKESIDINNIRNLDADARQSVKGLLFALISRVA